MAAARAGAPFTPDSSNHGGDDLSTLKCSFPGCSHQLAANSAFCSSHAPHRASKARLPLEHEPGSVMPITRRKTGTATPFGTRYQPNSPSGAAPLKPVTIGVPKPPSPQRRMSFQRDVISPPDSSHEAGPPRKKARHDTPPSGLGSKLNKEKADSGVKPKQPRRSLYAKTAPGPELQFERDVAHRPETASPVFNKDHILRDREGILPHTSPQTEARTGIEPLRNWFRQIQPAVSIKSGWSGSILADSASPTRPAAFVAEESKPVGEERWRLPLRGEESIPIPPMPPISEPSTLHRAALEPQLFPGSQPEHRYTPLKGLGRMPDLQSTGVASKNHISELDFDSLIYSQEGTGPPPPGVRVKPVVHRQPRKKPQFDPEDGSFFMHIDPRLHWPQPRSEQWHAKKQEEIKARGGRKANFGKAAERLAAQGPVRFEDTLPLKIRANPEWARALKTLEEEGGAAARAQTVANGSRAARKDCPGLRRHASAPGPTVSKGI